MEGGTACLRGAGAVQLLVRTHRCTRTRRSRVPSRLSVAHWRCQFWADCTTNISERKFPTGTGGHRLALVERQTRSALPKSGHWACPDKPPMVYSSQDGSDGVG